MNQKSSSKEEETLQQIQDVIKNMKVDTLGYEVYVKALALDEITDILIKYLNRKIADKPTVNLEDLPH